MSKTILRSAAPPVEEPGVRANGDRPLCPPSSFEKVGISRVGDREVSPRAQFGERYKAARSAEVLGADNRDAPPKQASVLEFVVYFYSLIRDDAAMVAQLDRAVKERYYATNR